MLSRDKIDAFLATVTPSTVQKRVKQLDFAPADVQQIVNVIVDEHEKANKTLLEAAEKLEELLKLQAQHHQNIPKNKAATKAVCGDCHQLRRDESESRTHRPSKHSVKCYGSCNGGTDCLMPAGMILFCVFAFFAFFV